MKEITMKELCDMFDKSVHEAIERISKRDDVSHVVVFENQDFCSSEFGKRTAMIIGPGCTYKTLDDIKNRYLNDLPSQR